MIDGIETDQAKASTDGFASLAAPRYIVIPPWSREEQSWNPPDDVMRLPDLRYLGRIVLELERITDVRGLTFYFTYHVDALPEYGRNVVAFVLGDEWSRHPAYVDRVRAVFKTYGVKAEIDWTWIRRPERYELVTFAQDIRVACARLPSVVAAKIRRQKTTVYDLPLGYYRQLDLPIVPINERSFDIYFGGSVTNGEATNAEPSPLSRGYWMRSPKTLSRLALLGQLEKLSKRRSDLAISIALTHSFIRTTDEQGVSYSRTMMQTKICVVPRGTSRETYRYFEGLRYGCVVIAERLPSRWFYDRAPVIHLRDWSQLDKVVERLLSDPAELLRLQTAALEWWSSRCSEAAVAEFVAQGLGTRL